MPFLIAAIRFMRELLKTDAAVAALGADTFEEIPVLKSDGRETDDEIAALQRAQVFPADSHPVGTCSMLPEHLGGVVNPELEVYGVKGLRIVDASVIPLIPGAHPMSTIYAVAEKAADIIKMRYKREIVPP
jgi:choline dehydrogenase-like flavoprotein